MRLRQLSDRTSLRTKLITAVLGAGDRGAGRDQRHQRQPAAQLPDHRSTTPSCRRLTSDIAASPDAASRRRSATRLPPSRRSPNIVAGIQQPGSQLSLGSNAARPPRRQPPAAAVAPQLPDQRHWASSSNGVLLTVPRSPAATPGGHRRRPSPVTESARARTQTVTLVVGVRPRQHRRDDPPARSWFDLIVGGAIVVVLAIVGDRGRAGQPAPAQRHRADRRPDRQGAPGPPHPRARPAHRDRQPRPLAQRDAQPDRDRLPRPGGVRAGRAPLRGPDAPVHRRRQPRAAHPADHDPRLRRVLPPARRSSKRSRSSIRNVPGRLHGAGWPPPPRTA